MTYRHIILAAILAVSSVSAPAFAKSAGVGSACYTPEQMQAEQTLRLHSELMDITVTCRTGSNGENLTNAYVDFTKKNINVLHGAEQTMGGYYATHKRGEPHDVDRLRTMLANEFGQKAADMSSPVFCGQYRDAVLKFDAASPADVQNEVQRMIISERSYVPACASGTAAIHN